MTKRYVGIDLGGTNLKLGLVAPDGKLLARHSTPTEAEGGPDHVLERMAQAVRDLCRDAKVPLDDVAAIGAAAPGPLDTKTGVVVLAPNLPGWRNIHVRDVLQKQLGRPVILENDANVAAYGEFRCGAGAYSAEAAASAAKAGRRVRDMVILTLGTGIGGGIILDGKMFRGTTDTGAELGHMIVHYGGRRCACGIHGCLEAYASATAVVGRTEESIAAGELSSLADRRGFSCKDVFDAADAGDRLARRIVEETADYLAAGITTILHVLNPEMVVLTGGMMSAGDPFLDRIRRRVKEIAFERASSACEIGWSTLGGDAGILGAALAAEAFDRTGRPA